MQNKGFTLIEILVVIVILGLLATFLVPRIISKPDEARVVKAKSDIKALETALKMYRLDTGRYPTTDQGLQALIEKPEISPVPNNWNGPYLDSEELPKDPWGNEYVYRSPGEYIENTRRQRDYEIICLGADSKIGGEGFDADIKNYEIK
ncbi:MAG: type II secretion system major pseudopilin GspG [Deferribacterota bacterium]|nr:type II secretion system major pseudopilin GspG [Deferribacterota bacterium]